MSDEELGPHFATVEHLDPEPDARGGQGRHPEAPARPRARAGPRAVRGRPVVGATGPDERLPRGRSRRRRAGLGHGGPPLRRRGRLRRRRSPRRRRPSEDRPPRGSVWRRRGCRCGGGLAPRPRRPARPRAHRVRLPRRAHPHARRRGGRLPGRAGRRGRPARGRTERGPLHLHGGTAGSGWPAATG